MNRGSGTDPLPDIGLHPAKESAPNVSRRPPSAMRVMNGPKAGYIFPLCELRMIVGRNDPPIIAVDIDVSDCSQSDPPAVSRRHAELQWVEGQLNLIDLGSTNGTWVNHRRIDRGRAGDVSAPIPVYAGDQITLADLEVELIEVDSGALKGRSDPLPGKALNESG